MPRLSIRILMFLSSYAPLFALLAWRTRSCEVAWISLSAISVISVAGLLIFVFVAGRFHGAILEIASVQPRDAETLAYVATYLIPFLALDLTQVEDVISFAVFMAVLGIISVTSHALFVNPVLSLFGYHTFDVTDKDANVYFLVTRDGPEVSQRIRPISAGRYVRFEGWRGRQSRRSTN
jgi:hypothetical protein